MNKEDGWKEIENISNTIIFKFVIILIGILISFLSYQFIKDVISIEFIIKVFKNKGNLVYILILIPLHEYSHAIIYPKFGLSDKTIIGIWPKKFVLYSYYDGTLKRNRLILAMLNPIIILTVIPVILIAVFKLNYVSLAIIILINPIGGAGDIFYSILIITQIPKNSLVKTDTSRVFWKKESS